MDDPAILALETAQPAHGLSQRESSRLAVACCASDDRQARLVRRLYETTTVHRRASVLATTGDGGPTAESLSYFYPPRQNGSLGPTTAQRMARFEQDAPPLAAEACAKALHSAGLTADCVTHLLTVTCTGFASPGVEHQLIERLGLRSTVRRVQVGFMGCHATLNGLQVARATARSDPDARVLLCGVELCSLHFQYGWHEQRLVANALFADGAGAVVIGPSDAPALPRIIGAASNLIPGTERDMAWVIGDHGFEMTLSPRVPALLAEHLRPWLDDFLAHHCLGIADVKGWCIHAGGPRIVTAVGERIGLTGDAAALSRTVLRDHGNMSSVTVLFILQRLLRQGPSMPCVMLSFGPGLVAEAVLLA